MTTTTAAWEALPADRAGGPAMTGSLSEHADALGAALERWAARDDTRADAAARQAANTAMDAMDGMLAELHLLRSRLVTEIRVSDDATAARVDELLARRTEEPR